MKTEAYLSSDRQYRYWLTRIWDSSLPMGCIIGVNPSTADETADDPTIRKDIGFMKRLGMGGVLKLNVGAYRSTDPKVWRKAVDPIGPENHVEDMQRYIDQFGNIQITIAAWGRNGAYQRAQCQEIYEGLPGLMCLGFNSDDSPVHTLMLGYSNAVTAAFHEHPDGINECTACDHWAGRRLGR